VLEDNAVCGLQSEEARKQCGRWPTERNRQGERGSDENAGGRERRVRRDHTGGNGARRLDGVAPVALGVKNVVEEVRSAGAGTVSREDEQRFQPARGVAVALRENEAGEEEQILRPLERTGGGEVRPHRSDSGYLGIRGRLCRAALH
jgi:hypothetical protein